MTNRKQQGNKKPQQITKTNENAKEQATQQQIYTTTTDPQTFAYPIKKRI